MATEIGDGDEAARPVLVLCGPGLYDALVTVSALRALRRAYPGRPLVLAGGPAGDLLRAAGVVDAVLPVTGADDDPPGLRLPGPGERVPHTAVDLSGATPAGHRLLLSGRPDDVLWFAATPPPGSPDMGWGLDSGPHWDDTEHDVDRWCRLVAQAGAATDPQDLLLDVPSEGAEGADAVVDAGLPAGPVVDALAARGRAAAVLPAHAPALHAAALVAAARVVVARTGSGAAALAVATGTPSVLLPGDRPVAVCGPRRDADRHAVLREGASPDDVASAVDRLAGRTTDLRSRVPGQG